MKRILPEFEYNEEQLNTIRSLAADCNLLEDTVKILYARGLSDRESILNFLNPSKEHFISPFKMSGMKEAVELITRARNEGWAVAVYGDYDADGICAATIMYKSLLDFGIDAYVCVPERKFGYGLSVGKIDELFEVCFPQLIITVDCGISCAEEVEYIKEQGAEVIVTDHHELPERIPDCICINPKFSDDYIYDNLCGAGVAFKVGCALNGEDAYKYLDFAAIATVADSVPLMGENRDIVAEGLKLINSTPRKCYIDFISKGEDKTDSQTISFSLAPKINAAGRMGDAAAALKLFTTADEEEITSLSMRLSYYNSERQKRCDELYLRAKELLKECGADGRIIMLWDENWNAGFVGIVAARLAEEFSRPVILFIRNGEMLRGSARSVENVNIFEALKYCSAFIDEFGGHSQAAGVNIKSQNFENLKKALEDYLCDNYNADDFIPTIFTCGTLSKEYSARFARELQLLEPYGVGNKRPVFETEECDLSVRPIKPNSPHLSFKCENLDMMYFGGAKNIKLLNSSFPKKLIFEYNVSTFRGREYVKGFVREINYISTAVASAAKDIAFNGVFNLARPQINCNIVRCDRQKIEYLLHNCGDYGTLFIASEYSAVENFARASRLPLDIFMPSSKNLQSAILVSPDDEADLSGYKNIVYLDNSVKITNPSLEGKTISIFAECAAPSYLMSLDCRRETLLKIYSAFTANYLAIFGNTAEDVAKKNNLGYEQLQIYFALKVFEQLSLVSFDGGKLTIYRGVKTDLNNSELYRIVKDIVNG